MKTLSEYLKPIRVFPFRRGSGYPTGKRASVSWTISSVKKDGREGKTEGGGGGGEGNENKEEKKEKPAGSDLQEIGLWYGGSLFMNAIIGPGIFGTPKGVLAGVGSVGMCMVMWTFSALFSMGAALCFAELRESVRREGVEYAYITEAFGPLAGFVYSWMRIAAAEPVSTAVFALAFTDYVLDAIYEDCGPSHALVSVVAGLTVLSMALINVMSTKLSERFQHLAIVGKTSALSVVIIMGIVRMVEGKTKVIDEGMTGTKWDVTALAMALYNGLWAYGGWANVNHVTSGIKKPPRNVPRVVKTVLPLVLIVYLLVVLSYFTAMTRQELLDSRAIGVTWAEEVLGPASSIISIGVCLTALGSLNATFLSAGRLSGVAAKNGQMPDVASWVHVRSKTPIITVATRCVIAILAICLATGQQLLRFYIFCVWMFHGMSILALLLLRYKNKHKSRPYKVDLWIPVLVVLVIFFLLLAPFLEKPDGEFIAAVVLIGMSLICYYPINLLKEKSVINVPDKITIWLQLFLRIAPKRDLRRERRSMLRRMSLLARESILITPSIQSPEMMRRFSRRMSRLARAPEGSPALIRRLGDEPQIRKRINRGSSLAEADLALRRERANSLWGINESKPSPAIIRKKHQRSSRSFNQADVAKLPSVPSLPILKNRFNTTPEAKNGAEPGALAPPNLHVSLRPKTSAIPEEPSSLPVTPTPSATGDGPMQTNPLSLVKPQPRPRENKNQSESDNLQEELEVVADFESDGGGEYEVLAHPNDVRRMSFAPDVMLDNSDSDSSNSTLSSDTPSSQDGRGVNKSIFSSLFAPESSTSTSDSDSSMDEEGNPDEGDGFPPLPSYYYNDEELESDEYASDYEDESSNNNQNNANNGAEGGQVNNGFVVHIEPDDLSLNKLSDA